MPTLTRGIQHDVEAVEASFEAQPLTVERLVSTQTAHKIEMLRLGSRDHASTRAAGQLYREGSHTAVCIADEDGLSAPQVRVIVERLPGGKPGDGDCRLDMVERLETV